MSRNGIEPGLARILKNGRVLDVGDVVPRFNFLLKLIQLCTMADKDAAIFLSQVQSHAIRECGRCPFYLNNVQETEYLQFLNLR